MAMLLSRIAAALGAFVPPDQRVDDADVVRVVAGDRMSDLVSESDEKTLIVTNLAGPQLASAAAIMDVPGICLLKARRQDAETEAPAGRDRTFVMVSPYDMYQTCGRLYELLGATDTE